MLYVPRMTKNLIFISTLEDKGYIVTFESGKVNIHPKDSKVAKVIGVKHGSLFRLQFELAHALVSSCRGIGEFWHRRMAHLHHGALNILKEIVTGFSKMKTKKNEVCKGCALGKYAKTSFPSSNIRSKGILDLVHSYVCGPMTTVSLNGYDYYVTFIDDFSKKTWIYFLKNKDELFSRFKVFKALMENQTGRKIKILRFDNGGEYTLNSFKVFCA